VVTADSVILDRCVAWFNLAAAVVGAAPRPWLVDLTHAAPDSTEKRSDSSCPAQRRD
jgi:hypothetical protein